MDKKIVIGVDFGSDSVRAVVADGITGKKLGSGVCGYSRWLTGKYQDAEKKLFRQHPLDYLEGLEVCVRAALDQAGKEISGQVLSISIDATGSTPCPANRQGIPLALMDDFSENENAIFIFGKIIQRSMKRLKLTGHFRTLMA